MNHGLSSYTPLVLVAMLAPNALGANDDTPKDKPALLCGFSTSAEFVESAPRDLFRLKNHSSAQWDIQRVALDLRSSAGQLIFDITAEGAGVEVFQPFRSEISSAALAKQPEVGDGDQMIVLTFDAFSSTNDFTFSIDVDDQLRNSELGQIRVSGGEMQGAMITLNVRSLSGDVYELSSVFNQSNQVDIQYADC